MNAIEFKAVKKSFGSFTALHGETFSVEQGQVFGFLGPNGAGKTTSIRCLMDFIRPDSGSVEVLGLDAQHNSTELKSKIGYLPADTHLHREWTGQQHLDLITTLRGVSQPPKSLISRLEFNLKVPVRNLSTGNKQKLAIILAFLGNPELVVMDEPTQGLDPILQNQFYEIVGEYQKTGGTIFMSSHNLTEVERLCKQVAIINKGHIVAEETLEGLREKSSYHISVTYAQADAEKIKISKDVTLVNKTANTLLLKTRGNLNEILATLNTYPIKDLEVLRSSLDEIFLEYYHV